jgi:hypothetical protein
MRIFAYLEPSAAPAGAIGAKPEAISRIRERPNR